MKPENDEELAVPEWESAEKRKKESKRKKSKTGKKRCPLSCTRRKKGGESTSRKRKGKKKGKITSDKSSTKKEIRKVKQAMKRGSASKRKRRSKSKSRKKRRSKSKSKSGSRSRNKSKSRSTNKSRSRSVSKKKGKGTSDTKQQNLLENRQHLMKSQSLSASQPVSEKALAKPTSVTDSARANTQPSIKSTPQSPVEKPEFQPLRQTEDKTAKKKDGAPPSTAIDIDSSMRQRRRKKPVKSPLKTERSTKDSERQQRVNKYSGELVKGKDNRYQTAKTKQEIAFEPSIGVSDIQPYEEIDSNYPAQRIVISNFVRKSCLMKRWLYEDSYPINGGRPTMKDLICNKRDKCAVKECCCSRRSVCDRPCKKGLKNKRTPMDGSVENERIRGELQRLDVILKNLDD